VISVRPVLADDLPWINRLQDDHWGGRFQVAAGESYRPADLPGFVAEADGQRVGYAALRVVGEVAWVGLIHSLKPGAGVGRALIGALEREARSHGCHTLRAITTNDNLVAQQFYRSVGFRLVQTRCGAVSEARKLKPAIPTHGTNGIPITDELEYELGLDQFE
jgi:ribosomal protein S18 acetylase RimI-like enzyme